MTAPIGQEQWAEARRLSLQTMPKALAGLPDILMPFQKKLNAAVSRVALVVAEKSRRIGATWGLGAEAVLTSGAQKSAGGMDTLYLGYNLDMAREFIDTCAMWAKSLTQAASDVQEFLFTEQDDKGADRAIQAFRISFASGFEIVALSSRPRSLRGRQGLVILDEYAFHDDAEELLKAAMALLIWGGKVVVISTHNGVDNPFNQLINEIREKRRPGEVVRCTFDEARRTDAAATAKPRRQRHEPPVRRPYTDRDLAIIDALTSVSFFPGTSATRFARDMASAARNARDIGISEAQARYLRQLAWKFRRQMPANLAYPLIEGDEVG
jgi:hypothetical protein